jgi:hypothetical protein
MTTSISQISLFDAPATEPPRTDAFINTIGLKGDALKKARRDCVTQEERILNIFRTHNREMTPFEVEYIYERMYARIPITSIRRSITLLTTKHKQLVKCDNMKPGLYGQPNHTWKLAEDGK